MKTTEAQIGVGTLHQFVRPLTRGELARRLKAGETCEVASHVEAMTTIMLCHWLDCTNFTVEQSSNRGWSIYRPNPAVTGDRKAGVRCKGVAGTPNQKGEA